MFSIPLSSWINSLNSWRHWCVFVWECVWWRRFGSTRQFHMNRCNWTEVFFFHANFSFFRVGIFFYTRFISRFYTPPIPPYGCPGTGTPIGALPGWFIGCIGECIGLAPIGDDTIWFGNAGDISFGKMKFMRRSRTAGNNEHSPLCAVYSANRLRCSLTACTIGDWTFSRLTNCVRFLVTTCTNGSTNVTESFHSMPGMNGTRVNCNWNFKRNKNTF